MESIPSVKPVTTNLMQLLRPEEAAQVLRISRSLIYQLLRTGEIPVVRIGRACRIRPQDIEVFINLNLTGAQVSE